MNNNTTLLTIDFESFYSKEFSLSKITTQEYVLAEQFEVVGVAVKLNDEPTEWFSGTHGETKLWLQQFPWDTSTVIAHNAQFDGSILEWLFDIHPATYFCTMMASRPTLVPFTERGSSALKNVSKYLDIGEKGTEIENALGLTRSDFTPEHLAAYADYCIQDVELCRKIYDYLEPQLPASEQLLIDATVKKFTQPVFELDRKVLEHRLAEVVIEKEAALESVGVEKSVLMSNPQFAEALTDLGAVVPLKISPTTGKETFAFAKGDNNFLALKEHPNPKVVALVNARLTVKSTQEETRLKRFIAVSEVMQDNDMKFGIPLLYYGAHTGRLSGQDKLNLQNLPRGGALRRALKAPEGCKVIAGDLSQIEARITATLAGEKSLERQFANGEDVYSIFATKIFNRPVSNSPETKDERFVGKSCILSLQYGVGKDKLYETLKAAGLDISLESCTNFVKTYRDLHYNIKGLWDRATAAIVAIINGKYYSLGHGVKTVKGGIVLPNGMRLLYPGLRQAGVNDWGAPEYVYLSKGKEVNLYGAKLVENMVQALARIVVSDAELYLYSRGFHCALQVHDELVYVVREDKVEQFSSALMKILTRPVLWMPTLPVDAEVSYGNNYYEAK